LGTEARSPETRALAEEVLAEIAVRAGAHADELVVIGGLTPGLLASTAPVPHLGTMDVDLLLEVGFAYDDDGDVGWIEDVLRDMGCTASPSGTRWVATVGGVPVLVDLIADRPGSAPARSIPLPGCAVASAVNLPGPAAARCDAERHEVAVPARLGGGTVSVAFAGLGGYLLSKAAAAAYRGEARDFYDFYFVVLHNDRGGPSAAAAAVTTGACGAVAAGYRPELLTVLRAAADRTAVGARAYAAESRHAGDGTDPDVLGEDAVGAAFVLAGALGLDLARGR
jgi:hypothetical protein